MRTGKTVSRRPFLKPNRAVANFADSFSGSVNALKGLLIIIVAMDHNDLLRAFAPGLFRPLTFHVLGFLLLPFLVPLKPPTVQFIRDRLIRYFVPFWWVLTFATVIYSVVYRGDEGFATPFVDWLAASVVGSAPLVKVSSGFYYLWFLPSLAGLVIFLAVYQSLSRRWQTVFVVLSVAAHLAISVFPEGALRYLPLGPLIVLWVFPLGLLFRRIMKSAIIFHLRYLVFLAFVASYWYLVLHQQNIEIMTLDLLSITEPLMFSMQDINAVFGVLTAMWIASKLNGSRLLNACGHYSLMVYLLHPLVFFLGMKLSGAAGWGIQSYALLAAGVISVALTILVSLVLAIGIARMPFIRSWVMPKGWDDWAPVRLVSAYRQRA